MTDYRHMWEVLKQEFTESLQRRRAMTMGFTTTDEITRHEAEIDVYESILDRMKAMEV